MSRDQKNSNDLTPEAILRRLFELVNEVRSEYKITPLQFNSDLAFKAGEHACNMSTNIVPFGHAGFYERQAHAALAINFSENVAKIPESNDPAQDLIVYWISRPSSISRIISTFTHTGIGIAASDDGYWYCTQLFATFRTKLSKKDYLLIVSRFINSIRVEQKLMPLAVSMTATARLINLAEEVPEAIMGLTPASVKIMFSGCIEADYISESLPSENFTISQFFEEINGHPNYIRAICKEYTDMGFVMKRLPNGQTMCTILLGKCMPCYRKIDKIDIHYPMAAKCLQIVNEYRIAHKEKPLILSHQWCRLCNKHTQKLMKHDIEIDCSYLEKLMKKHQPESKCRYFACSMPLSIDPLRDVFLIWLTNFKIRKALLESDYTTFGFGIDFTEDKTCYVSRIIGIKPDLQEKPVALPALFSDTFTSDELIGPVNDPLYINMTSDPNDEIDILPKDVSMTFRLVENYA